MQQERIHNNALVLSQLPVEREEVLDVLRELEGTPIYMDLMMSPVVYRKKKEAIEKKLSAKCSYCYKFVFDFVFLLLMVHIKFPSGEFFNVRRIKKLSGNPFKNAVK